MIMPCMNSTSAAKGALAGVQTVFSLRNLLGWPGAPGCTIGADCCAKAMIAPTRQSATDKDRLPLRAMRYYTIHVSEPSIESGFVRAAEGPLPLGRRPLV